MIILPPKNKHQFEQTVELYNGIKYTCPKLPDEKIIDGYKLKSAEQKFIRPRFPTVREYQKLNEESQLELLVRELDRKTNGYWFFNNGVPTFLPPTLYFFLTYWNLAALTSDGYPEYRDAQRKWCLCIQAAEEDNDCLGLIMMTGKRFAKTEIGLAHLYNLATNGSCKDARFTILSLNATEAQKLFVKRVMRSHKKILPYLVPESNETNSKKPVVTELTFYGTKTITGEYSDSLDTILDWRPAVESAMQGERPRAVYLDESGAQVGMDLLEFHSTTIQQLVLGKKTFGKLWLPTTLESMNNRGAEGYKELWEQSDINDRNKNNRTKSGLWRVFKPFCDGREGFIDQYGYDLIDEAIEFRENELANATPGNVRKLKRQYPMTEDEAFDLSFSTMWESDVEELIKQTIDKLIKNPVNEKYVVFFEDPKNPKSPSYAISTTERMIAKSCHMIEDVRPNVSYKIGVDSIATSKETGVLEGSKFAFTVYKAFELDKDDYMPVMTYEFRPDSLDEAWTQLYCAGRYYSQYEPVEILGESNVGSGESAFKFFTLKGAGWMLKKHNSKVWIHRDESTIERQFQTGNRFLRAHVTKWKSIKLLRQLLKAQQTNTDLADSALVGLLLFKSFSTNQAPDMSKRYTPMPKQRIVRDESGATKRVWNSQYSGKRTWNM